MAMSIPGSVGAGTDQPTEKFRQEHVSIKEHLDHLSKMTGNLPGQDASAQRDTMKKVVIFLKDHSKPHAEWEEKVLYPAVDERAGPRKNEEDILLPILDRTMTPEQFEREIMKKSEH